MKNKKLLMPLAGVTALAAVAPVVALTSCNKDNKQSFTVQFISNGGSAVQSVSVKEGDKLDAPADPTRLAYTFAGWYLNPECTTEYDFEQPVTSNMLLYAGWEAQELTLSVPDQFTLNYGKAKGDDGNDVDFYSTKTIHVYDEDGQQIDSSNFYFESDRPSVAIVDEDGVITPAPLGDVPDNYANISVYLKGEQRPFAYTRVNVVKQASGNSGITLNADKTAATYTNYTHNTEGVCIIPDYVNIGTESNKQIPIYLGTPTDTSVMYDVTTLILPHNLGGIANNTSFGNGKLQNVLFGGTIEEFKQIRVRWIDTAWMGDQVMYVQCTDGRYELNNRYEAELALDETIGHIVMKTKEFDSTITQNYFRFDYSKFGSDILASNRLTINVNNADTNTSVVVWLNGSKLSTSNNDYTFTNNIITFTGVSSSLNASANIIVQCTATPEAGKKVYLSCDAEWPNKIKVTKHATEVYYVNDPFTIKGLEITASNGDESLVYVVPTEYLKFYLMEDGVKREIKPGYIFKDKDVARRKSVYVHDTITGLETNYTISVWKE